MNRAAPIDMGAEDEQNHPARDPPLRVTDGSGDPPEEQEDELVAGIEPEARRDLTLAMTPDAGDRTHRPAVGKARHGHARLGVQEHAGRGVRGVDLSADGFGFRAASTVMAEDLAPVERAQGQRRNSRLRRGRKGQIGGPGQAAARAVSALRTPHGCPIGGASRDRPHNWPEPGHRGNSTSAWHHRRARRCARTNPGNGPARHKEERRIGG